MSNIIAFSGSNSKNSINGQLVSYAAKLNTAITIIKLTDYDIPMYGIDLENENGIPDDVIKLLNELVAADGVMVSTPEHNSLMPAFFKNIIDWLSRTKTPYLEGKPLLVAAVSPGRGAAKSASDHVAKLLGYGKPSEVYRFNLPEFSNNFNIETGEISNKELAEEFQTELAKLKK